MTTRITPVLRFDHRPEDEASLYVSTLGDASTTDGSRHVDARPGPKGRVTVIALEQRRGSER